MNKLNPEAQIDLNDEVIERTAREYGVEVDEWHPVTTGIGNTVAVLGTAEGDLYAKYYRSTHSQDRLENELALVSSLPDDVPVPRVIETRSGDQFTSIESNCKMHLVTVTSKSRGNHPNSYSPSLISQLALAHGIMHTAEVPQPLSDPLNIEQDYNYYLDDNNRQLREADERARSYLDYVRGIWLTLPSGLVHLDLVRNNILTDKGMLTGIIDFEDTALAPYVFCLAGTLWDIRQQPVEKDGLGNLYLERYQSVRPLEKSELDLLDIMVYLRGWIALHGTLLTAGDSNTAKTQMKILANS